MSTETEKKAYYHVPVLLNEVLEYLNPKPGQNYIDATLGGGGYTEAIYKRIQPKGKVLAIDLDQDAIANIKLNLFAGGQNIILHQGNFSHINKIAEHYNFSNISGVVADLGFSSYELDQSSRGLSFQKKELLDMRFDQRGNTVDAKFILNNYDQKRIEKILNDYGEEKFTRQIVKKIFDYRINKNEIRYTTELYDLIKEALPKPVKHKTADSARRVFQALRIEVNHELDSLQEFLPKAFELLVPGGRLVVVSFHSLEDRIVKQYFNELSKGCVCPIDFPQCVCGKEPKGKILTKKIVTATDKEIEINPRSKPAKLRAILKI